MLSSYREEIRSKISATHKGKKKSEGTQTKISISLMGNKNSCGYPSLI